MILSFDKQFIKPLLEGSKIHTIREDKSDKWKIGNKIHFATGVRTKKYHQFMEGFCVTIEKIEIKWDKYLEGKIPRKGVKVYIDGIDVTNNNYIIDLLVKNDGFKSRKEFFQWFNKDFKGKIIHWTRENYSLRISYASMNKCTCGQSMTNMEDYVQVKMLIDLQKARINSLIRYLDESKEKGQIIDYSNYAYRLIEARDLLEFLKTLPH